MCNLHKNGKEKTRFLDKKIGNSCRSHSLTEKIIGAMISLTLNERKTYIFFRGIGFVLYETICRMPSFSDVKR